MTHNNIAPIPTRDISTLVYSLFAHAAVLDVLGDLVVNGRGQRQVEEAVCVGSAGQRRDVSVEFAEGTLVVVLPTDVGVPLEECQQPLRLCVCHLGQIAVTLLFCFHLIACCKI